MKYTIGTTSINATNLAKKLIELAVGESLTYAQINALIGRDVQQHRHILNTARNIARREKNMLFDCVHNEGVKRLTDEEIININSARPFERIKSAAKIGVKNIQCATNLTNDQRITQNATISMLGTIAHFTKSNSIDNVKPHTINAPIAPQALLDLFNKKD